MLPSKNCGRSTWAYKLAAEYSSGGFMFGDLPKGRSKAWLAFIGIAALGVIGLSAMVLLSF
jgi:hypothetical protein